MESQRHLSHIKEKSIQGMNVFVIHAEKFVDRKKHMKNMLRSHPFVFEYILEDDVETLSKEELNKYFSGGEQGEGMNRPTGVTSCALKHFYAYEKIIDRNLVGALILEDDAILQKNFDEIFSKSMSEYDSMYANENVIISYEDTRLRFIPRSQRRKGRYLYPGDRDRMTGAYYINRHAACAILEDAQEHKCHLPIDLYHRYLLNQGKLLYLWCQPTIATQGSHTGLFVSTLSPTSVWLKKVVWRSKLAYKKFLYYLR